MEFDKIYLLYNSSGEWDDYQTSVVGCYLDGYECQIVCDKHNNDLKKLKEQKGFQDYSNSDTLSSYNEEYEDIMNTHDCWVVEHDIIDYQKVMREKVISDLLD